MVVTQAVRRMPSKVPLKARVGVVACDPDVIASLPYGLPNGCGADVTVVVRLVGDVARDRDFVVSSMPSDDITVVVRLVGVVARDRELGASSIGRDGVTVRVEGAVGRRVDRDECCSCGDGVTVGKGRAERLWSEGVDGRDFGRIGPKFLDETEDTAPCSKNSNGVLMRPGLRDWLRLALFSTLVSIAEIMRVGVVASAEARLPTPTSDLASAVAVVVLHRGFWPRYWV